MHKLTLNRQRLDISSSRNVNDFANNYIASHPFCHSSLKKKYSLEISLESRKISSSGNTDTFFSMTRSSHWQLYEVPLFQAAAGLSARFHVQILGFSRVSHKSD